jgi:tartrate-resistant acid phosphatase type 5
MMTRALLVAALCGCSTGEKAPTDSAVTDVSSPTSSTTATTTPTSATTTAPTTTAPTTTAPTTTTTASTTTGGTSPTTTTTTTTTPEPVRFVALGDAGEGNDDQFLVADAIKTVCDRQGCDFALYLGDNFYESGVDSVSDPQWEEKFEIPYADLDFPFLPVLGNHDLGLEGLGVEFYLSDIYVDYTDHSDKWTMPGTHYYFEAGNVKFLALDTTKLFFSYTETQTDWIREQLATVSPGIEHVIAYGHHPYISNGEHGNAGNYEGIWDWVPLADIPRGDYVKEFFEEEVCGNILVYFSGHDHNRQWLEPNCGTEFIVTGAGAKTTDLVGRGNPSFFEDDTKEGFIWVEIEGNRFTGQFYDLHGVLDFEQTFML